MTFEEEFPSLKRTIVCLDNKQLIHEIDIRKACLDKARVKEKITQIWNQSSSYEDFKKEIFYWINEELGGINE